MYILVYVDLNLHIYMLVYANILIVCSRNYFDPLLE